MGSWCPGETPRRVGGAQWFSGYGRGANTCPPLVKPSFDAAVKSAISAEKAFLSVSEGILTEGALWLDGLAVDPRTRTTTGYEGTHLGQW